MVVRSRYAEAELARAVERGVRQAQAGIPLPANLEFLAADLERETLPQALRRSALRIDQPVFISWLGVSVYLPQAAVDAIFSAAAGLPVGSQLVFSFAPPRRSDAPGRAEAHAAALEEPWLTRLDPPDLVERLLALGFSRASLLTPDQIQDCYLRGRTDGFRPLRRLFLASTEV